MPKKSASTKSRKGQSKSKKNKVENTTRMIVSNAAKKRKAGRGPNYGFQLSPCAWKYARALIDPFGAPPGACIPSLPSIPSDKRQYFARGTMVTGTAGFGYVAVAPFAGASATPAWGIVSSNSGTYAGTSVVTTSVPTGASAFMSNSQYSSFGNGLQAKLVGCGLRIKCTTAPIYRQGTIVGYVNPTHQSINTLTGANLAADPRALMISIPNDEWVNIVYSPVFPADYGEYIPATSTTNLDAIGSNMTGFMAFAVTGASTTNPLSFMFEVFGHYEIVGISLPTSTTTDSDTVGLSAVQNVINKQHTYGWLGDGLDTGKIWNAIQEFGMTALSGAVKTGAKMAMNYFVPGSGSAMSLIESATARSGPIIEEV